MSQILLQSCIENADFHSIVEYATKDQARTAIDTLSNKNLMGRLIYVREASRLLHNLHSSSNEQQDRETEPRFQGSGPPRGGFDGGYGGRGGGYGYGGGRGGFGGGPGGQAGPGRQIYVANVSQD